MIKKIEMGDKASFRDKTELITDKKINLIYGLNGTGKTTISNYLSDTTNKKYNNCSVIKENGERILVYNQRFIDENFYQSNVQKGIFTLSKENKEIEIKIKDLESQKLKIEGAINEKSLKKTDIDNEIERVTRNFEDIVWQIKGEYSGGDRLLDFCLEGVKSEKKKLANKLIEIEVPSDEISYDIESLKNESKIFKNSKTEFYSIQEKIKFDGGSVELNRIFLQPIIGNDNSEISSLINMLDNSDWVKQGLRYIPQNSHSLSKCPFCQNDTIDSDFIKKLNDYFDDKYKKSIEYINYLRKNYIEKKETIPNFSIDIPEFLTEEYKLRIQEKVLFLNNVISKNLSLIDEKLKYPSNIINLDETTEIVVQINDLIEQLNCSINELNEKISNKLATKEEIKKKFWNLMRLQYDSNISSYKKDISFFQKKLDGVKQEISKYRLEIDRVEKLIKDMQKRTVNISDSIENINKRLFDLGISDFSIKEYDKATYKLVRGESDEDIFRSLSEGEKMLISFLYFIELCHGKQSVEEINTKKIIVIDDPISSLSHIHVFNIGTLIKRIFFNSEKFEQVFVLTHSLYFFYELTILKQKDREEKQKLFRIVKLGNGSKILPMHYEEIQNDYQSYWSIIKNKDCPNALIANCMRNIIEYFFNFTEKYDLNNLFQEVLKEEKYQPFYRYINRESHSIGQNIFDYKEFDYDIFFEAFKLVFEQTGYIKHFNKMIKKIK